MRGKKSLKDQLRILRGESGLTGYFGTSDARQVEKMILNGDKKADLVYEALACQIAKDCQIAKAVAALAVVCYGRVDAIILTGGLAHSARLTTQVVSRTAFIAPTRIYPGENEMEALAFGAHRILTGEEKAEIFEYKQGAT